MLCLSTNSRQWCHKLSMQGALPMLQVVLVVLAHLYFPAGLVAGALEGRWVFGRSLNFGRFPILLRRHSHQACAFMAKSSGFPQLLFEKISARITALWPRVYPVKTGGDGRCHHYRRQQKQSNHSLRWGAWSSREPHPHHPHTRHRRMTWQIKFNK